MSDSISFREHALVARNYGVLTISLVLTKVLTLVFYGYMSRQLGAADFGVYFYALALMQIAITVSAFGTSKYATREIAQGRFAAKEFLTNLLGLRLSITGLATVLAVPAVWLMGYQAGKSLVILTIVVSFIPNAITDALNTFFYGREKFIYPSAVDVATQVLLVAFSVGLIYAHMGLEAVALVWLGTSCFSALVRVVIIWKRHFLPYPALSLGVWRVLLRKSLSFGIQDAILIVGIYSNVIILERLASDQVVGWYNAAYALVGFIFSIFTLYSDAYYPNIARQLSQSNEPDKLIGRVLSEYTRIDLLVGLPLTVGVVVLADRFIYLLYGPSYEPAANVLRLIGLHIPLSFFIAVFVKSLYASGRQRLVAYIGLIDLAIRITLSLALIPWLHEIGAALVFLASGATWYILSYLTLRPSWERGQMLKFSKQGIVSLAVVSAFLVFLRELNVFVLLPAAAVLYVGCLFATGAFSLGAVRTFVAAMLHTEESGVG